MTTQTETNRCKLCQTTDPTSCILRKTLINQAESGGQPLPDSNQSNGPLWPFNHWDTYFGQTRKVALNDGCLAQDSLTTDINSITQQKNLQVIL